MELLSIRFCPSLVWHSRPFTFPLLYVGMREGNGLVRAPHQIHARTTIVVPNQIAVLIIRGITLILY